MVVAEDLLTEKDQVLDKKDAKISKVMREYKSGKLKSGKPKKKVVKKKQAIAIALSEAGVKKKKKRRSS